MTTNTRPVPNIQSAIAATADGKIRVYLINPWSQFFQQFVQKSPAAINIDTKISAPNSYQANQRGKIMVDWFRGTTTPPVAADPPPIVTFSRGDLSRDPFVIDLTGVHVIPISIGDTITWSPAAPNVPFQISFLGD